VNVENARKYQAIEPGTDDRDWSIQGTLPLSRITYIVPPTSQGVSPCEARARI